jgi:hypothetical protein
MKKFNEFVEQISDKRNLTQEQVDYDEYNEMTRSELRIAINSAKKILGMMDDGVVIERWQISEIVTASDSLASVCTNLGADYEDEEDDEEDDYEDEDE